MFELFELKNELRYQYLINKSLRVDKYAPNGFQNSSMFSACPEMSTSCEAESMTYIVIAIGWPEVLFCSAVPTKLFESGRIWECSS